MSVLFTGRTEAARGRSESRPAAEPKALEVRLYLRDLLNELAAPVARPVGSPASGAAYLRTLIERTERHETSRAHWVGGRSCVLHGHSESHVLLRVVSGTLVEERYLPDGQGGYRFELQTLEKGQESFLPRGAFHRLHCLKDAVTLHAFSPPPADATSPVPFPTYVNALEAARQRGCSRPLANLPAAPNSGSAAAARPFNCRRDRSATRRLGATRRRAEYSRRSDRGRRNARRIPHERHPGRARAGRVGWLGLFAGRERAGDSQFGAASAGHRPRAGDAAGERRHGPHS